jgi:hypothetical protein
MYLIKIIPSSTVVERLPLPQHIVGGAMSEVEGQQLREQCYMARLWSGSQAQSRFTKTTLFDEPQLHVSDIEQNRLPETTPIWFTYFLGTHRGLTSTTSTSRICWPATATSGQLRQLGKKLSRETGHLGTAREIAKHPAYSEIIQMGTQAIPFILEELKRKPAIYWLMALKKISGASPVPPAHAGKMKDMVAAWLEWGKAGGYLV